VNIQSQILKGDKFMEKIAGISLIFKKDGGEPG
jgi:hypothetical protein